MKTPGILLFIGGLITLIYGLMLAAAGALMGAAIGGAVGAGEIGSAIGSIIGIIFIIFGILIILSGVWVEKKPQWAWVGIVFSLLTLFMPLGGFLIGPFLANVGAAIALKSQKPNAK